LRTVDGERILQAHQTRAEIATLETVATCRQECRRYDVMPAFQRHARTISHSAFPRLSYIPRMNARGKSPSGTSGAVGMRRMRLRAFCGLVFALVSWVLTSAGEPKQKEKKSMNLGLSSTAFADGQPIPDKYTCQGRDVSPPLKWSGAPPNTKSFALIADDPDAPAGTWVHWVLFDLPANVTELAEDVPKLPQIPSGGKQGLNDFRKTGYGGPCPPPGKPHRYFFKLYALDAELNLKSGANKKDVEHAMEKHVLAQGQLMGTYQRK
jgi:hypothetical protein